MNERIEEIKNEIREILRIVSKRGQPLSAEMKRQLNEVLDHAERRIEELRQEEEEEQKQQQQPQPEPQGAAPIQPIQQQQQEPFQGQPGQQQMPVQGLGPPPSPEAQLLWMLANSKEDAFVKYLHNYPSENTRSLLQNPAELERTIQYLHAMMPSGQPPVVDGIPHADLNSSNVWGTLYDPSTKKMKVRFQGGAEYEYDGIPKNIYNAVAAGNASARTKGQNRYGIWYRGKNPSIGAALNQYVKEMKFPYRRVR